MTPEHIEARHYVYDDIFFGELHTVILNAIITSVAFKLLTASRLRTALLLLFVVHSAAAIKINSAIKGRCKLLAYPLSSVSLIFENVRIIFRSTQTLLNPTRIKNNIP